MNAVFPNWRCWSSPCYLCGSPVGQVAGLCDACLDGFTHRVAPAAFSLPGIGPVMVPWWYDYPLIAVIRALKYEGALYLAEALAQGWRLCTPVVRPDWVMPIPLSRRRWRERGYNQALELARPLAHALACPVVEGLQRTRHTRPQADLSRQARQTNVAGAFRVIRAVTGRHVALVDDVLTTGATIMAAASALQEAGVGALQIWVLAQARNPDDL